MNDWDRLFRRLRSHLVRISTPTSNGSGFFFAYNENQLISAFATAAHVVRHAEEWGLPIKLDYARTGRELILKDEDRIIFLDNARDSASIITKSSHEDLPSEPLPLIDPEHFKEVGVEVAWAGYPAIADPNLCLFTGTIAAFLSADGSYLVDGVAIHGVSGGPLFTGRSDGKPELLGSISSYLPNHHRGDSLPGLMIARDIKSFQDTIRKMRDFDQAAEHKAAKG